MYFRASCEFVYWIMQKNASGLQLAAFEVLLYSKNAEKKEGTMCLLAELRQIKSKTFNFLVPFQSHKSFLETWWVSLEVAQESRGVTIPTSLRKFLQVPRPWFSPSCKKGKSFRGMPGPFDPFSRPLSQDLWPNKTLTSFLFFCLWAQSRFFIIRALLACLGSPEQAVLLTS